ncbi:hypothetical protein DICVIV_08882 [Dictyocaulus viviparus]|uniref:G-protein coupled receptors family 1 profile domain-containing protein n=1 Tax=Dictyocaulus viviparus TaxID=29172 RepID=A0A0D8XKI5_DICVI|nr:hypothetical protein DICVIV_08882 [Dictyocaulus viviparus]
MKHAACAIWGTTVNRGNESHNHNQASLNSEISNRKLMYMLMIVVACFSLCWFPLETYLLLNEIRPEVNGWKYINVLFFCSHWLAMSNSCLNPIIYGLYNDKYNREYRRVFRILRCQTVPESFDEGLKFETEYSPGLMTDRMIQA